jgi:PKD repeat protein
LNDTELSPGEWAVGTASYTVTEEDIPGPIVNTATATAEDPLDNNVTDSANESVAILNRPPYAPYAPDPDDDAAGVSLNPTLSVGVSDPEGDNMNVSFFDASDDSLIGIDTDVESGGRASLQWAGLSYGTRYSWYAVANDSEYENRSETWSFTTMNRPGPPPLRNTPPVADASASETFGFIGTPIYFDGSRSFDSDGTIVNFSWDFDDGTTGYGEKMTHIYSKIGTYHVTLMVIDDVGAFDSDTIEVVVSKANNPPSVPMVDGPTVGHKNISYDFTALSFDVDNDMIQYIFDWGDGEVTTTGFLPNGTSGILTHMWANYGVYEISVKAFDNETESGITNFTILIDVLPIDDEIKGYLVDDDSDDAYELFDNVVTGEQLGVEMEDEEDAYLIDSDGDGKWDYVYDLVTDDLLTYYEYVYQKYLKMYKEVRETPGFDVVVSLLAIIAVALFTLRRRRYR